MAFLIKIILGLGLFSNCHAMTQVDESSVVAPSKLGRIGLFLSDKGYHISINDRFYDIKSCWVDPKIRKITIQQLKAFIKNGYIKVNQLDNEDIVLRAHVRGLGGGPVAGIIGYWGTKVLCYGGVTVGAVVATVYAAPVIAVTAPLAGAGVAAVATAAGATAATAATAALGGASTIAAGAATS